MHGVTGITLLNKIKRTLMQPNPEFYRPDIDGIRAIAIIAVLLYHMMPNIFFGGYVGVDIFFVISGYLITSIILRQIEQRKFSFLDFYIKRVLRLFPSLILVLIFTLTFGWFFLLKREFLALGKHVVGGAGFIANFVLYSETGYFNKASELKPLLHLWSLGIEEQFYFIWPFAIFLIFKITPRILLPFLLLCIGYSFSINLNKYIRFPDYAFFLPQSRFWEIFVGALVSYISNRGWTIKQPIAQSTISIVGFALCMLGFALIDKNTLFPGYWALLLYWVLFF